MASTSTSTSTLREQPTKLDEILAQENSLQFRTFTADTAFSLGCLLRQRIPELCPHGPPAAIQISHASGTGRGAHLLFHAVTRAGTGSGNTITPSNDDWIERKRETVLFYGTSTYYQHFKWDAANSDAFATRFLLGQGRENAGKYALYGGGFPVRVKGVEGIVAVIVVSGLKHFEDHGVIVQVLEEWFASAEGGGSGSGSRL